MKRIITVMLAGIFILSALSCLSACKKDEPAVPGNGTTAQQTVTEDPNSGTDVPQSKTIDAAIKTKKGDVTESDEGSVTIKATAKPATGDKVTASIEGRYLKVSASGIDGEHIVYLPDGEFVFEYPQNASVFLPNTFTSKPMEFTFTIPSAEELSENRNLASNPFDSSTNTVHMPHAKASNVYDQSGQFIARNAIDGYKRNNGHGNYPLQSWGPTDNVKKTDYFKIDFGREVEISEIVLYLRADGFGSSNSHDAYFSSITVEFSDGTSVVIEPEKTAKSQNFPIETVKTTYVKLTGFVTDKSNSQGWAAITEIEVYGKDIIE